MRLGKPTMRFHVFPRSWQGYQDSCHWVDALEACDKVMDKSCELLDNLDDDLTT